MNTDKNVEDGLFAVKQFVDQVVSIPSVVRVAEGADEPVRVPSPPGSCPIGCDCHLGCILECLFCCCN
eukprot:snap_masked-scaffold_17-processed-gene-2.45-mRNA-1 protein AED:1.00 eAED:1.00 QI:0/-1/0/0/-1/1/1/0/67